MAVTTEERAIALPAVAPRSVSILGSTGSVGCQTIDLLERDRGKYELVALTANRNLDLLIEQALSLRPQFVAIGDENHYEALKSRLSGSGIEVGAGASAILEAAERPAEWVMAAIVGAAGLDPTLRAVRRGAMVALANK
ncbi:MAG: hypothetical protein VW835_16715, partial [Rickettsiales bacterium]